MIQLEAFLISRILITKQLVPALTSQQLEMISNSAATLTLFRLISQKDKSLSEPAELLQVMLRIFNELQTTMVDNIEYIREMEEVGLCETMECLLEHVDDEVHERSFRVMVALYPEKVSFSLPISGLRFNGFFVSFLTRWTKTMATMKNKLQVWA